MTRIHRSVRGWRMVMSASSGDGESDLSIASPETQAFRLPGQKRNRRGLLENLGEGHWEKVVSFS